MLETLPLPITSTLTGGLVILLVILSGLITLRRAQLGGLEFGDANDIELRHRVRAHGNFIEIAPFIILAIALMELASAPPLLLWILAGTFFLGRMFHALRMYLRNRWLGLLPIITQHLICLTAGAWLISYAFS